MIRYAHKIEPYLKKAIKDIDMILEENIKLSNNSNKDQLKEMIKIKNNIIRDLERIQEIIGAPSESV